jgi:surface antigen
MPRPAFLPRSWLPVLGLALALLSCEAAAQPVPIPSLAWPGLTPGDLDRMQAAAARLYEGRSIGTVERWRNPHSNDAGEVTLLQSFETHGMPCRTIAYAIAFATAKERLDHYRVNWCRVPDGTWKIVEVDAPR